MGLGPSTKMTTLYHFNCPLVKEMCRHADVDLAGVIVAGVSENYQEKVFTAQRVGNLIESIGAQGAIVVTDGWGNHHIDFVSIIEEIGKRGLPTVGMSFFGLQGRLVYTSDYLDTLIDFNKGSTGYESCVVGENHLSPLDAYKAVAILKNKIEKQKGESRCLAKYPTKTKLTKKYYTVNQLQFGEKTELKDGTLTISQQSLDGRKFAEWIAEAKVRLIEPEDHQRFVNSNLDFSPIARKLEGGIGEGVTQILEGVTVMLTGVEKSTGFQPANIGSSEGILAEQVQFDTPGTPGAGDRLIGIDFLFQPGMGRSKEGIRAAHTMADQLIESIRQAMGTLPEECDRTEVYGEDQAEKKQKIMLVKVVSGLGNMYETALFPCQPGGYLQAYSTMEFMNLPVVASANQILDGVIHSLL